MSHFFPAHDQAVFALPDTRQKDITFAYNQLLEIPCSDSQST